MSGDNALLTAAIENVNKIQEKVSEFEKRIGLGVLPTENLECKYLSISGEEISKYSPEQCNIAATELATYGIYIQRLISKEKGYVRWMESKINKAIASELNQYEGYYSHSQRRDVAVVNNEYASKLEDLRINSQLKVDVLEGLTFQINQLCRVLMEAQNNKRQRQ